MTSVTVTTTVGWIDGATQSLRSKKLGDIARKKKCLTQIGSQKNNTEISYRIVEHVYIRGSPKIKPLPLDRRESFTWIIGKTSHFVWSWTSRYINISLVLQIPC